ncbi:MAG: universal stress protein [Rhodospirillales bacterium]
MALKTIVVHLTNDEDHMVRLEVAKSLARQHDAFLTALFITRPSETLHHIAGRGVSRALLEQAAESAAQRAVELETEFKSYCDRKSIPHQWIVADGEHLEMLAEHAHAADLLIVTQPNEKFLEDRLRKRLAEEVVMNSGLPVMVLPRGWHDDWTPKRILIGWKPTREAVRAVRDALPLLREADEVMIGTISPSTEDAISTLEISQYLMRHGIESSSIDMQKNGGTGVTLLAMAQAHDIDLMVLGAYGHSRIREIILGGVTRSLLREADIPLFFSH